ncbi:hypothetical protein PFLUV_G00220870 [Perca fluviatilis]|uniref:Uncharacterized protein n=1 Tax=Perca fluviatilis TaxID=8168 RepID=A0A6A5ENB0_PERFL|nr:hypothetical protein PFLUV_G00220870 [Perca fluviatilis]
MEREGGLERKNEEEVRLAARLVPTNAGLLMKHRAGYPIIQVALHGNEDYSPAFTTDCLLRIVDSLWIKRFNILIN